MDFAEAGTSSRPRTFKKVIQFSFIIFTNILSGFSVMHHALILRAEILYTLIFVRDFIYIETNQYKDLISSLLILLSVVACPCI